MTSPISYTSPTVSVEALKHSIAYKLMFIVGKDPAIANQHDWLNAVLFAVRDRMVERWLRSNRAQLSQDVRQVYYLSMEFLIGRTLSNALLSMGIYQDIDDALNEMGLSLGELLEEENDPGSGQRRAGAIGRLLPGFAGDAGAAGSGLRHSLRIRHVQTEYRKRPTDGVTGLLAGIRQSVGVPAS
jgi:glycogen phosphorylase